MKTSTEITMQVDPIHILLVGNNPMELGIVLDKLREVHGRYILTEVAFDLKSLLARLLHFKPTHILIDDNVGKEELRTTLQTLSSNKKTKEVPITVLKNSNHECADYGSIAEYVLKKNLSGDSFSSLFKNALKLRRAKTFLAKAYNNRKGELLKIKGH